MIDWGKRGKAAQNIFEAIGLTPMVKLNKVTEGINADVLVKLEWFSPTGSLKDRIYYRMITEAIKKGELKPGMEILETSTGNAGIACAFVGKLMGYPVTIILPGGMSIERSKIIQAYEAKLIYTPGAESDVDLCLQKQEELIQKNPGKYWVPSQYTNTDNIMAHYLTTGPEIWEQGTGGTIAELGRHSYHRLKGHIPFMTTKAAETTHCHLEVAAFNSYRLPVEQSISQFTSTSPQHPVKGRS